MSKMAKNTIYSAALARVLERPNIKEHMVQLMESCFKYESTAERIAHDARNTEHTGWTGKIFKGDTPEMVHFDTEPIRETLRRIDSEIIKRCAIGPPLWRREEYEGGRWSGND